MSGPFLPRPAVTARTGLQVVGDVRHLVKKGVGPLGAVPGKHEVHVESDLYHTSLTARMLPRQHVSEG